MMQQHAATPATTTAASLGLKLQLPPDTAESLRRQHRHPTIDDDRRVMMLAEEGENEEESFSSDDKEEQNLSGSDDWDDVMESRIEHADADEPTDDADHHRHQADTTNDERELSETNDDNDDDDVSLSPPPSLPIVVVNLEKLVGYVPSSMQEAEQLHQQVKDALCKDDDDDNNSENDQRDEEDTLSRHFEERAGELFEAGIAFHGDTSAKRWNEPENRARYAVVLYPEFLCRPDRQGVIVTARQWKRLLRPHPIPVVQRLLVHLAACSRNLSWKVDMNQELWELARSEDEARARRARDKDLLHWRKTGRKEQLEKLYQVRETFVHRLDLAKIKLSSLEDARDEAAAAELRRLRIQHGHPGGLEALDFESTMFAFDTSSELLPPSASINDLDNDREGEHIYSDADSLYDGDDDGIENSPLETTATDVMQEAFASAAEESARAKARRQAASRKHRRKLASQAEAAKMALEQEKVDKARAEEERAKERLTSPELRQAQAVVASLQNRLASVDELLESLQEEEWADEEHGVTDDQQGDSGADTDETSFSLLDQVLSMILGTLPTGTDADLKRHYEYLRWEHAEIVTEWKDYFGRLPPSSTPSMKEESLDSKMRELAISSQCKADETVAEIEEGAARPTVSEMRQTMNIIDNELDNWDDVDDWDALSPSVGTKSLSSSAAQTPPKKGLRPRGRV